MKKNNKEKIIYKISKISHPNYIVNVIAKGGDIKLTVESKLIDNMGEECTIPLENLYFFNDEIEQSNFVFNKLSMLIAECSKEELLKINNFFN